MAESVPAILEANPQEDDIILLGDFNADGDYLNEPILTEIFPEDQYRILITNDMDTMVTSDNTYDRIIVRRDVSEYLEDTARVLEFDLHFGLIDEDFVRRVSDHYPVYADYVITKTDDDDGS